ncbi:MULTISPECIES: DUF6572 domain-containing protein [unclassified Motilimonas]|uniref:DUF6572 domain-containing protein n=1 Tax=Motilimonas TaxID=1914248 RepID=UPI001E3FB536|nr:MULTISPECIES: DUF6572 domain-containing protein [unclassified Motilimonas]MCE0558036.1 hypothetical protein [Motilimonas sp. E26]MDO6526041.1 hypothetical protein [Motilimonas sp. 1_MG-2023]
MSVEQLEKVDLMSIDKENETLVLTILDALEWDEEDVHLFTLQSKINAYLEFIRTGEVYKAEPEAQGMRMAIEAMFKHKPHAAAEAFLAKVETMLYEQTRVKFSYGPNPATGYVDSDS